MPLSIHTILYPPKKQSLPKEKSLRLSKLKGASFVTTISDNSIDQLKLESVLNSISVQSDELLLGEEMWRKRYQQKRHSDNCLTITGRSKSVRSTFPTIKQAKDWSVEKEFWLTYIPRQHRIWEHSSASSWEYWGPIKQQLNEDQFLEELQIDPRTGGKISLAQHCERFKRQLDWEQNVISEYETRANAKFPVIRPKRSSKFSRDIARTQTMNRYKMYRKALMDNLVDVEVGTRAINFGEGISRRFQLEQMERLIEGYHSLKWVYDLNPELVESLAHQHLNGPGGKRWMNLSRVEVKKVLTLLEKSQTETNFSPYNCLLPSTPNRNGTEQSKLSQPVVARMSGGYNPNLTTGSKKTRKGLKLKGGVTLKPSQLMPLHVPGPEALHQNVLIRPYTPEIDKQEGNTTRNLGTSSSPTAIQAGFTPVKAFGGEEEEGLTIESFAPFYRS